MPRGRNPSEYFSNPQIRKPRAEIYADLDAYSMEYFADEPAFHERSDLWVLLPPLRYEGPRPLQQHQQPVLELDDGHQVHEQPQQPGRVTAEFPAADLGVTFFCRNLWTLSGVE
jgi:hypothetical protein